MKSCDRFSTLTNIRTSPARRFFVAVVRFSHAFSDIHLRARLSMLMMIKVWETSKPDFSTTRESFEKPSRGIIFRSFHFVSRENNVAINPFNHRAKIRFTTLHNIVNLWTLIWSRDYYNFSNLKVYFMASKIRVQLTRFPPVILRIIDPGVHDGLSRYQIDFPSVKSSVPRCLSADWPARHRFTNRLSIPRVITLITRLGSPARERRRYARKRVISVIISISAVPEISSSRSRYFRSVPCGGMRSELGTMMARLTKGAPDSLRVPSRRCLFYLIIIANGRAWGSDQWCWPLRNGRSTVVISGLIISQRWLFRYFCLYIYTIRARGNGGRGGRFGRGKGRIREDRAGIRAWSWTIKAILGRTLVKTHFVASLNPDNSTLRFYPPITP